MKRNMKKIGLVLLALCAVCVTLAVVLAVGAANEDQSNDFVMLDGASVRIQDPTGLRFTASISENKYREIISDGAYKEGYSIGMLIVPKAYFDDYAAQDSVTDLWDYFTNVKGKKIDLAFTPAQLHLSDEGDAYLINGAIVGIKEANLELDFRAVAYVAKQEGETVTRTYTGLSDVRNITQVATAAVNSGKESAETEAALIETYRLNAATMNVTLPDNTSCIVNVAGDDLTLAAFAAKIRAMGGWGVLAFREGTTEHALTETVSAGTVNLTPVFGANVNFVVGDTAIGSARAIWGSGLESTPVTASGTRYRILCGGKEYASLDAVPLSELKDDVTVTYEPKLALVRSSADMGSYQADGSFRVAPSANVSFSGIFAGSEGIAGNAWVAETKVKTADMTQWNVYGIKILLGADKGLIIGASLRADSILNAAVWSGNDGDETTWGGEFADGGDVASVRADWQSREYLTVKVAYMDGTYRVYLNGVLFHTFENYQTDLGTPAAVGVGTRLDSGVKVAVFSDWSYEAGEAVACSEFGIHTDADEDGKCDWCGASVKTPYTVNVDFATKVPYAKDTSLVTAKIGGVTVEIRDGKLTADAGTTIVFSHPNYMDVTVVAGEEKTLDVTFVRPYISLDQSTYNESDRSLTTNGGGKIAVLGSVGGKDFVVQYAIDPKNIISWTTYGIGIQADGEFVNFGFSLRSANTATTNTWEWGFVSPSRNDWGNGSSCLLFGNCGKDFSAVVNQLANKTLDHIEITLIYHNDTHVLDIYFNGRLVNTYATGLTTDAKDIMLISTDTSTTYLDWNWGVSGTDAYNTILEAAGVHQWNNGTVTTPATCTAEGVMTYTCTACGATKTAAIAKADHADHDGDGKCDTCGTGVVIYNFLFGFKTIVPYSQDTSLVTVTLGGETITLTDGKYKAAPGNVFVFSHPAYMPVTVTVGTDTTVAVDFIRARVDTTDATYNAADGSLTMAGEWKRGTLFNAGGKDFAVQIELDPKNIEAWNLYGIEIRTANSYYIWGFSRRSNTYDNNTWNWAFVSPADYNTGVFAKCGDYGDLVSQLASQSLERLVVTFIYHNDTHVVDSYVNDTLVTSFQTPLTDDVTDVKLAVSNGYTNLPKFLDWNYGAVGSDAYTAIEESVKKS